MKIALIGSSHLACVKAAWRSAVHEAAFLGGTAGHGGLAVAWGRLDDPPALTLVDDAHPTQRLLWRMSRGDEAPFSLEPFDAIVFVGLISWARPWHLSNCPIAGDLQPLVERGHAPVSFAQWRAMYGRYYRAELQRQLVEWVQVSAKRPILSLTSPCPRADAAEFDPRYETPARWRALPAELKAELVSNERALVDRLGAEVGVRVVHPPRSILIDGHYCPTRYSMGALGSRNLAGGAPQYGDDPRRHPLNISHKNRDYGAVLVEQIHRCLDGGSTEFDPQEL